MRRPPSFTCSSARPTKSRPSGSCSHEVAAAVGAVPAEAGHRREPLGVLGRVEVAGQADAADDQLADLARRRPARRPGRRRRGPSRPAAARCAPVRPRRAAPRTRPRSPPSGRRCSTPRDRAPPPARRGSGGQASPPKIRSRTWSSASSGQSAARVGTVDTTVMRCATSHGPRSIPVRTSERGAGTRQAPLRQASHISSHDASKATDSPASTRSSGPIGSSARNRRRLGIDEGGRATGG